MRYEDFLCMVCEDYNICEVKVDEFAYMLPERILEKMPSNTPLIFFSNDRQLASFITLFKIDVMCIYVSLTANKSRHDMNRHQKRVVRENAAADFGSFGYVLYETMNPSHVTMKPSHETLKPLLETMNASQLRKGETIKSGEIFSGKREPLMKLHKHSVIEKCDFSIKNSWKHLFYAKCLVPAYSWKICASTMSRSSPEFLFRKYTDLHTFSATDNYSRHRQANAKCIGNIYVEGFIGGSDLKGIRPKHIMECRGLFIKLTSGYSKAHSALAYAREMVRDTHASGYQDLPSYLYKKKKVNPGTITELELDAEKRFKYLFIAFGACIKVFLFMRRVIIIDATHLSCKFRGVMLVAACQDVNRGIYPIAFGIVNAEDEGSWEWFFTQLRGVVGDGKNMVFISARCATTAKALTNVFPEADRGICLYHLGKT